MGPKKKGGGKKRKANPIITTEESIAPFGLSVHDIVRTPLGLLGTVLGVRYDDMSAKETGRVWVRYENGHEAPLEPRLAAGSISALGYRRCPDADHTRRDVLQQDAEARRAEEQRRVVEEVMKLKAEGRPIPEHLLPPAKASKPKKDGKKEKGKQK